MEIVAVFSIIVVAVLGFFLGRMTAGQKAAGLEAVLAHVQQGGDQRSPDTEAQFAKVAEVVLSRSQENLLTLAAERFETQRTIASGDLVAQKHAIEMLITERLETQRAELTEQLETQRADVATQRAQASGDLVARQHAIEIIVAPMRESLAALTTQIGEIEKTRRQSYGELTEQVRGMGEQASTLRAETARLREALRTTGTRGRWGEMQLRRIVEAAGMIQYCDFDEQVTVNGSADNKQRPDVVVRLTEGRSIAVDSKVPLESYLNAMDAPDEASGKRLLENHARAVKAHVTALSGKMYWKALDPSPDITVLFVPGEPFLRAALEADPMLLEYAMEKQVVLTTPTMLVALLRTIAYGWRQDQFSAQAHEVYDEARELLNRLGNMHGHMAAMGKALTATTKTYNDAVGSMEGRVLPQARRVAEMGVSNETLAELPTVKVDARELSARRWALEA